MTKEMLLLGNLNCPSCAADLERAVKGLKGVQDVTVTFASGTMDVAYDESIIDAEQIDRTVASFGVTVTSRM